MSAMYPAPRWFREAVREWIGEYGILCEREYAISDLFTRLAKSQPPDLRVVVTERGQERRPRRSKLAPTQQTRCQSSDALVTRTHGRHQFRNHLLRSDSPMNHHGDVPCHAVAIGCATR